jgi:hypothetical protein
MMGSTIKSRVAYAFESNPRRKVNYSATRLQDAVCDCSFWVKIKAPNWSVMVATIAAKYHGIRQATSSPTCWCVEKKYDPVAKGNAARKRAAEEYQLTVF